MPVAGVILASLLGVLAGIVVSVIADGVNELACIGEYFNRAVLLAHNLP